MDYSKTKIYKIWSPRGDMIYIGATTKRYLSQRLTKHTSDYRQWKKGARELTTSYKLFDEYGVENCLIELLEAKACNDKDDQKKLEGQYIRAMNCVNKNIPDRTMKEYHEENKEKIAKAHNEYMKEYVETNKEKLKERKKEYREKNKEKIAKANKEYRARKKAELNLI